MINFNLIQNVLGFIFNKKRFAVYSGGAEVLSGMSVLSYNINNDSNFVEHPIESGAVISDHHVFNPIEITCKVAFPHKGSRFDLSLSDLIFGRTETFEDTYKQLVNLYKNSVSLMIKTEADAYDNMYITSIPTDVTSETADRQIFYLIFKEAISVQPQYIKMPAGSVKNSSNASYVKTGEVLPSSESNSSNSKSLLKRWFG